MYRSLKKAYTVNILEEGIHLNHPTSQPFFLLTSTHSYETDYTWGLKGDVLTSAHKGKNAIMQELANIQRNYNYFRV